LRADLADYVRLKYETGSITFAPGNAFELALAERFDAVLATELIEHVAHPDEFLRQLAGLARPGGVLIVTTPNGAYFRNKLPRFSDIPDPSVLEQSQFQPGTDGHLFVLHGRSPVRPGSRSRSSLTTGIRHMNARTGHA
jgi:2-polyprenyl-3-methyl-5-hydroxy-6-metoxy-1,4-benzoquinol methylase